MSLPDKELLTGRGGGEGHAQWRAGRWAGEERKERADPQTQRTRSPLNAKTIALATWNYWGGEKFKREGAIQAKLLQMPMKRDILAFKYGNRAVEGGKRKIQVK